MVTLCSVGLFNLNSSYSVCYSAPLQGSSGTLLRAVTAPLAACLNEQRSPRIRVTLENYSVSIHSCTPLLFLAPVFSSLCSCFIAHTLSQQSGVIFGQQRDMTAGYGGLLFCNTLVSFVVDTGFFFLNPSKTGLLPCHSPTDVLQLLPSFMSQSALIIDHIWGPVFAHHMASSSFYLAPQGLLLFIMAPPQSNTVYVLIHPVGCTRCRDSGQHLYWLHKSL